jgi:hypothetical protein
MEWFLGLDPEWGETLLYIQRKLRYLSVCLKGGEALSPRMPTALYFKIASLVCETFSK